MPRKRNRDFGVLVTGQLVSTVGNNLFAIALPWYVYVVTGSKSALALVGLAQTLPAIVGLFAGVFADRWRKKRTMIASDLIRAALCVILFFCVTMHSPLWPVLALVLGLQIVGQFFSPAASALFPLIVEKEDYASASGIMQSSNATAQLVGTLSGGALMGLLGAPLLFLLDAVSFLVSAASVVLLRVKEIVRGERESLRGEAAQGGAVLSGQNPAANPAETNAETNDTANSRGRVKSFRRDWLDGVQFMMRSKFLMLIIFSALVTNAALSPFDITMTAWVKGPMHGNALQLGIINGALFVGIIAGGLVLGIIAKKIPFRAILVLGLAGIGVFVAAFSAFHGVAEEAVVSFFVGISVGCLNGSLEASMITLIPQSMLGRISGLFGALATIATPLGMAIFGALMVHISLTALFISIGAMCAFAGVLLLLPIPDDKDKLMDVSGESAAETL